MSTHSIDVGAGDHRRAIALLLHYVAKDYQGVAAVLRETVDVDRPIGLIGALASVITQAVPALTTEAGVEFLRENLTRAAAAEGGHSG